MRHKRLAAAEALATAKERAAAKERKRAAARGRAAANVRQREVAAVRAPAAIAEQEHVLEVIPWLRQLGFGAREARDAAARCREMPDASLEERVRVALSYFHVRGTSKLRPGGGFDPAASLAGAGAVAAGP